MKNIRMELDLSVTHLSKKNANKYAYKLSRIKFKTNTVHLLMKQQQQNKTQKNILDLKKIEIFR